MASSIARTPDSVFRGTTRPADDAGCCCFVVITTSPTVSPRSASHCAPLRRRPSITTLAIAVVITFTCEVTAAVTSQVKVITTAIASVVMLGRRLNGAQWLALLGLTVGLVVITTKQQPAAPAAGRKVPTNTLSGVLAMLLATVLSAYSGVFLERLFKTIKLTLWLQSIQLSLFALPVAGLTMLLYDRDDVVGGRIFVGFNHVAWLAVVLAAVGGVAVSMALKYADNIQKTFAVGVSIVLNCGVSAALFDVPLTRRAVVGVGLVVGSTFVFQSVKTRGDRDEEHSAHEMVSLASSESPPRRSGTPKDPNGESPPPSAERPNGGGRQAPSDG